MPGSVTTWKVKGLAEIPSTGRSGSRWSVGRLLGSCLVNLGCCEEHRGSCSCSAPRAHGQRRSCGRDVVGEVGDDIDVCVAEGKVEGFHLPTQALDQFSRCLH